MRILGAGPEVFPVQACKRCVVGSAGCLLRDSRLRKVPVVLDRHEAQQAAGL